MKTLLLKITCVGVGLCAHLNIHLKYRGYFKHISKTSQPWGSEKTPQWTNHLYQEHLRPPLSSPISSLTLSRARAFKGLLQFNEIGPKIIWSHRRLYGLCHQLKPCYNFSPKIRVSRALRSTRVQNFRKSQYKPARGKSFFILLNFLAFFLPSEGDSAQESVCSSSGSENSPDTLDSKPASAWLGLSFLFPTVLVAVRLKYKQWNNRKVLR